jgi:hypothetical protein
MTHDANAYYLVIAFHYKLTCSPANPTTCLAVQYIILHYAPIYIIPASLALAPGKMAGLSQAGTILRP